MEKRIIDFIKSQTQIVGNKIMGEAHPNFFQHTENQRMIMWETGFYYIPCRSIELPTLGSFHVEDNEDFIEVNYKLLSSGHSSEDKYLAEYHIWINKEDLAK